MVHLAGWGWGRRPRWVLAIGRFASRVEKRFSEGDDLDTAIEDAERVLQLAIKFSGLDGGPTTAARRQFAWRLEQANRFDEARLHREQLLASMMRHLPLDDLDTLHDEEYLAANLARSGMANRARPLWHHILEAREISLGPDHEDCLRIRRSLFISDDVWDRTNNRRAEESGWGTD
jgi:hypothetical protein